MEFLTDYNIWASFISLSALEIILGIDNIIFIALVVAHLPEAQRNKARIIGLSCALCFRIIMLLGLIWLAKLEKPLITIWEQTFSGKDIVMLFGGLFLIYKATDSIHGEIIVKEESEYKDFKGGFASTIFQIIVIDIIFSLDSVVTAVGITKNIYVIIAAMTVAMGLMLYSSAVIGDFIAKHPTIKMLAMSFIMIIGVFLVAEGMGVSIPKGYIYCAMAFSSGVEALNIIVKKRKQKLRASSD